MVPDSNRDEPMKILILCNKSPWPPKEGAPIAMNMVIHGLLEKGHTVRILAVNSEKYHIREEDIPAQYREKTQIELVNLDLRIKPVPALLALLRNRSYHMERFISDDFRNHLARILKQEEFDIIQLETLFVTPYIDTIRSLSKAKIVYRAHNIEHLIWSRMAMEEHKPLKKHYLAHLAKTLKEFEHKTIFNVDGIAAITAHDAEYFSRVIQSSDGKTAEIPVIDLPFGIDPGEYPLPVVTPEWPSLFSIGAMNWMPNAEGIKWFLDHVWPDVHQQFPKLTYYLAGRAMPQWMLRLQIPGVVVVGEVEDARKFIGSKGIMIVPLFSGSGIRIKIIEGMAAAKPIISTSLGAEGIRYINGENILIANAPCEFFDMLSLCLHDATRSQIIGQNARKLVETVYNRKLIIDRLVGFYNQLAG